MLFKTVLKFLRIINFSVTELIIEIKILNVIISPFKTRKTFPKLIFYTQFPAQKQQKF